MYTQVHMHTHTYTNTHTTHTHITEVIRTKKRGSFEYKASIRPNNILIPSTKTQQKLPLSKEGQFVLTWMLWGPV